MTAEHTRRAVGYAAAAAVFLLMVAGSLVAIVLDPDPIRGEEVSIFLAILSFGLLGVLILWRRPGNSMGWVFSAMGLSGMLAASAIEEGFGELYGGFGWFTFFFLTIAILPMLYPTGRTVTPRWRWVLYASLVAYALFAFLWIFQERVCLESQPADGGEACVEWADNPVGIEGIEDPESSVPGSILLGSFLVAGVAALVSLAVRFRRGRGIERQQLKWLLFAMSAFLGFGVIVDIILSETLGWRPPETLYNVLIAPFWLALPAAAGLAIFRYGLYDIDRIISRTAAYALVVATLTAAYVLVVVSFGALVEILSPASGLDVPLPALAAAVLAIAFQPVRQRATRVANRLVFGRRRTPYEALAGVGGGSLEELLPQIARLATESTAARRAVVWLSNGVELLPAAVFPDDGSAPGPVSLEGGLPPVTPDHGHTFPLIHQDDLLGAMTVVMGGGEELPADDRRLLADLAAHAAVTLRGALDAVPLPTGIVTFLMTDIEGSTRLWEQDPEAMAAALRDHDSLVRRAVTDRGGVLVKWRGEGDSTFSVFTNAAQAVVAAAALQEAIGRQPWTTSRPLSIRAALHTGEAELRERDYFGQTVNRCARLRALARGGQTLVSGATRELARESLPETITFSDLGERQLKDMSEPERVYEVLAATPAEALIPHPAADSDSMATENDTRTALPGI